MVVVRLVRMVVLGVHLLLVMLLTAEAQIMMVTLATIILLVAVMVEEAVEE